jgi:hypothetical protein
MIADRNVSVELLLSDNLHALGWSLANARPIEPAAAFEGLVKCH